MHRGCCNSMKILHKIAKLLIIMGFVLPCYKGVIFSFGKKEVVGYFGLSTHLYELPTFEHNPDILFWLITILAYFLLFSAIILFIASIKIPWQRTVGMIFSAIGGILSITIMILALSLDYIYSIHIGLFVLLTGFILSFIYYITKLKTA